MPDPIDIGSELRRRKALAEVERSLETVERLLTRAAAGPERRAFEAQRASLEQKRNELRRGLLADADLDDLRTTWHRNLRATNFGGSIDARWPILLLPLKVETRFVARERDAARPFELRIRFYPDRIAIDTHEDALTPEERSDGATFWGLIDSAASDDEKQSAWNTLLTAHGRNRAAFIARRSNPSLNDVDQPPPRIEAWSAAPTVHVFPEYLHVRAFVGLQVAFSEITANPIDSVLLTGLDPQSGEGASPSAPQSVKEFLDAIPPEIRWLVDFDEAERRGLAMRVLLTAAAATRGFDRLLVTGVRVADDPQSGAAAVEQLLTGHHFSDGLAIAPRGTATNNTESEDADFNSEPDAASTYDLEFGASRWETGDLTVLPLAQRDAQVSARALGIDSAIFERMEFADGADDADAFHMARALWPATLGYFLRQILADEVPEAVIAALRRHYLDYVRARGPLPNLRVERTPYGVLPVTSLRALKDEQGTTGIDKWLPDLLWRLRKDWLSMSARAPRLPGATDPERALFDVMAMLPTSVRFYSSPVLGEELMRNLVNLLTGGNDRDDISQPILQEAEGAVDDALNALGYAGRKPRVRSFSFKKPGLIEQPHLVASITDSSPFPQVSAANYLLWLATATPEEFAAESGLPIDARSTLLYRLMRTARRNATVEAALHVVLDPFDRVRRAFRFEAEIEDLPGMRSDQPSEILSRPFAGNTGDRRSTMTIGRLLHGVARKELRGPIILGGRDLRIETPLVAELAELTDSIEYLATRPKDRLQTAMCDTLDGCSHRLDAWITSLATRKLMTARPMLPRGVYVGAYGWLENVRRKTGPRSDGGFLLAPSIDQAAAAAVLRNGFIAHRSGTQASEVAVKLSSERVKTAADFFDRLRAGIPLAAALGYHFQRGLHDRGAALGLEQYLPALQNEFPLDSGRLTPGAEPAEEIAAGNVVNGRDLLERWSTFKGSPQPRLFGRADLPAVGTPQYGALAAELDRLAETYDAMKDVALAEALHQNVRGNYEAARAVSDAMAGSRHMPELDFPRMRARGARLKHRVVVPFPAEPIPNDGWPAEPSPRAAAAPELNRLARRLIGDPRQIGLYVRHQAPPSDPDSLPQLTEAVVTLDALDMEAIDFLEFMYSSGRAQSSELELRVVRFLRDRGVSGKRIELSFTDPPSWNRTPSTPARPQRMWAEVAPLIESLRQALSHARPALPSDLTHPDLVPEAALGAVDFTELVTRCKSAVAGLWHVYESLATAVAPFEPEDSAPPLEHELKSIQQRCAALAAYGFADALSVVEENVTSIVRRALELKAEVMKRLRQLPAVDALGSELDAQLQALAQPATDAAASLAPDQLTERQRLLEDIAREALRSALLSRSRQIVQVIFGRGFMLPLRFPVAADHALRASYDGLGGDPDPLMLWLHRMEEIHGALGDFGRATLISEIQTGNVFPLHPAQTPYATGEQTWAGIAEDAARIPADALALLFTGHVSFGETFSGLVLSDWEETIPSESATAGLTFHFDQSGSEPPQVVLLAVAPQQPATNPRWTSDVLFEILGETLDLARMRLVDADLIDKYGPLTPTIFLPHLSFDPNAIRGGPPL